MPEINPVTSIIKAASQGVETVAGVFTTNRENDAERSAEEQMALLQAYRAEFHERQNRNWVDSLADGFNRLIRPFIVTLIISIFVIAYVAPTRFAAITEAMQYVPDGYWALLSVIIAFYFGGRMQLKSQQFKFNKIQAEAARQLVERRQEMTNLAREEDEPDRVVGNSIAKAHDEQVVRESVNEIVVLAMSEHADTALAEKVKAMRDEDMQAVTKRHYFGGKHRPGMR